MSFARLIDLPSFDDSRGSLIAIEATKDIPFDIRRIYYIFNSENCASRGFHAHKDLEQLAICVSGRCDIVLDDGEQRETVSLTSPKEGLLIGSMIWREMHNFSNDCVLLILANSQFDESDYIRSYDDFKDLVSLPEK
ncbi:FdtA/QdtA family cupin domain-containing protein [Alphaproteobacteria bacterium]|nr:FdtA/QdtA family cupin domain-containing protein [Alphaproteobacteria bacterium]MDA9581437.1 FdtA/QdtA family cupin domain-containing protein [bacterium]MDA8625702.1 FdtA/QdtA family cupin domain-containing protein [Alphaproteobacteria bacterium]MDA8642645.1 FdtA/QdtA family cupin domain-containing protein [Alphaproteobacteria bacterium]MDA8666459.1 FdtA/QdtA family cupin domain-containing protein [Alphaproteobacteria bacterium]